MQLIPGTVVAERFRLIRQLGAGGMGAVWLAQHMGLGIPCAVKFILGDPSPELRGRFEREARVAAQIRSPHVVQVLDSGIYDGTPYMAMEYLEGEDLGQRLTRLGRLGVADTAFIMGQVARALSRAHTAGLVHRDLKPENIFLVRDEDREIAKVLDFGIAKDNTASSLNGNTRTGALLGTPYYMSPEQARGVKTVDHRADLWSLAVVAFQCVTGRLPFISDALGDLLIQIIMNPIPMPSQIAQGIPHTFDTWWTRAAQRDPALRFQTAKEFADALALAAGVSFDSRPGTGPSSTVVLPSTPGGASSSLPSVPSGPGFTGREPTPRPGPWTPTPMPANGGAAATPTPGSLRGGSSAERAFFQSENGSASGGAMITTGGIVAAAPQGDEDRPRPKSGLLPAILLGAVGALVLIGAVAAFLLRSHDHAASNTAATTAQPAPALTAPAPAPSPSPPPPVVTADDHAPAKAPTEAPEAPPATAAPASSTVHTPHVSRPPVQPATAAPAAPASPTPPTKTAKDFGF